MKQKSKGGKKAIPFSPPGQATKKAPEPAAKPPCPEIVAAINTLEDKIAFLSAAFADQPKSMAYRDALKIAVAALRKEAGMP